MTYNSVADGFHTKKLCSRLSSSEVKFWSVAQLDQTAVYVTKLSHNCYHLVWHFLI